MSSRCSPPLRPAAAAAAAAPPLSGGEAGALAGAASCSRRARAPAAPPPLASTPRAQRDEPGVRAGSAGGPCAGGASRTHTLPRRRPTAVAVQRHAHRCNLLACEVLTCAVLEQREWRWCQAGNTEPHGLCCDWNALTKCIWLHPIRPLAALCASSSGVRTCCGGVRICAPADGGCMPHACAAARPPGSWPQPAAAASASASVAAGAPPPSADAPKPMGAPRGVAARPSRSSSGDSAPKRGAAPAEPPAEGGEAMAGSGRVRAFPLGAAAAAAPTGALGLEAVPVGLGSWSGSPAAPPLGGAGAGAPPGASCGVAGPEPSEARARLEGLTPCRAAELARGRFAPAAPRAAAGALLAARPAPAVQAAHTSRRSSGSVPSVTALEFHHVVQNLLTAVHTAME